jgi:hypothetical protein
LPCYLARVRSLTSYLRTQARVIPLGVSRAYRDAPARPVVVDIVRRTSCPKCGEVGCASCAFVGWIVARETISVDVPEGATLGTRIKVEGVGDVVDGRAQSLEFEIVDRGDRAAELRAANVDFETKLDTAWEMERTVKEGRRRRRIRLAVGAASVLVLALMVSAVGSWVAKGGEGAPCEADDNCRSDICFGLQCVPECKTTRDCPSDKMCFPVAERQRACCPKP